MRTNKFRILVINYHYIRPKFIGHGGINGITPRDFETQISKIKKDFDIISAEQLLAVLLGEELLKRDSILLTFDDGLKEQIEFAIPILKKLNVAAIFFTGTGHLNDGKIELVHKIHLVRDAVTPANFIECLNDYQQEINLELPNNIDSLACNKYIYDSAVVARAKYILNFCLDDFDAEVFINDLFDKHILSRKSAESIINELYFSRADIEAFCSHGDFALGTHCNSHVSLAKFSLDQIVSNIGCSHVTLSSLSEKYLPLVSYPFGGKESVSQTVLDGASLAGCIAGFTMDRSLVTEKSKLLSLGRFSCSDLDFDNLNLESIRS